MFDCVFVLASSDACHPADEGLSGIYQVDRLPEPSSNLTASDLAGAALDAFFGTYELADPGRFSLRVRADLGAEIEQHPEYVDGELDHLVDDIWRVGEEEVPLPVFDAFIEDQN